jgi:cytochrome P450
MAALAMMSLAGMVGPLTHGLIATGFREFNNYEGQETHKIDVTKVWDQLDLENRDEVKRYLFECGRLRTPVSNSHRLATEDFTIKIRGKNRTFPKGTTIFIPIMVRTKKCAVMNFCLHITLFVCSLALHLCPNVSFL